MTPQEHKSPSTRHLYRACNAPLGGVCAGVADYFGIDAIVARVVTVAGTVLSGGLLGVAYAAMVVVVPKAPECAACYDVRPQAAVSDKSGPIPIPRQQEGYGYSAYSRYSNQYCSVGHIPPEPPASVKNGAGGDSSFYEVYQEERLSGEEKSNK